MSPLQEVPGECEWGSPRAKIGSILALQRSKENKSQANEVEPQHEFSRERVLVQETGVESTSPLHPYLEPNDLLFGPLYK